MLLFPDAPEIAPWNQRADMGNSAIAEHPRVFPNTPSRVRIYTAHSTSKQTFPRRFDHGHPEQQQRRQPHPTAKTRKKRVKYCTLKASLVVGDSTSSARLTCFSSIGGPATGTIAPLLPPAPTPTPPTPPPLPPGWWCIRPGWCMCALTGVWCRCRVASIIRKRFENGWGGGGYAGRCDK